MSGSLWLPERASSWKGDDRCPRRVIMLAICSLETPVSWSLSPLCQVASQISLRGNTQDCLESALLVYHVLDITDQITSQCGRRHQWPAVMVQQEPFDPGLLGTQYPNMRAGTVQYVKPSPSISAFPAENRLKSHLFQFQSSFLTHLER